MLLKIIRKIQKRAIVSNFLFCYFFPGAVFFKCHLFLHPVNPYWLLNYIWHVGNYYMYIPQIIYYTSLGITLHPRLTHTCIVILLRCAFISQVTYHSVKMRLNFVSVHKASLNLKQCYTLWLNFVSVHKACLNLKHCYTLWLHFVSVHKASLNLKQCYTLWLHFVSLHKASLNLKQCYTLWLHFVSVHKASLNLKQCYTFS